MKKVYKEINEEETETTINILYREKILSLYTNKADLQRTLNKTLGKPSREDKRGKTIIGSVWNIPLEEKSKITQMILKANIFAL